MIDFKNKEIVLYPNKILTTPTKAVKEFDKNLREYVDFMFGKMKQYGGMRSCI